LIMNIYGFIVLRKPFFNYDEKGRGAFSPHAPRIGDLYYAGIDRMPWFEVEESYYSNELPTELVLLRKELKTLKLDCSDFELMPDINKAVKLLEYSNKDKELNELIAVCSKRGNIRPPISDPPRIDWLGVDVYCHGYGSLIREGIFTKLDLFSDYIHKLNINGLFGLDSEFIDSYTDTYIKLAYEKNLEPIDDEAMEYLDIVTLGRVRV